MAPLQASWLGVAALVALFIGFLLGNHSGRLDMAALVGVYEDGSYSAGCLPGGLCERGN